MVTIMGASPLQFAVYAIVAVAIAGVAAWRLWPMIQAGRAKMTTVGPGVLEPTVGETQPVSDSDRAAPPGTRQWIKEILTAVDGAPEALKLAILTDSTATVATAQRKFIDHLRQPVNAAPATPANPNSVS